MPDFLPLIRSLHYFRQDENNVSGPCFASYCWLVLEDSIRTWPQFGSRTDWVYFFLRLTLLRINMSLHFWCVIQLIDCSLLAVMFILSRYSLKQKRDMSVNFFVIVTHNPGSKICDYLHIPIYANSSPLHMSLIEISHNQWTRLPFCLSICTLTQRQWIENYWADILVQY